MARVDTLLLAKYGIFQPVRRNGPLAMTIIHPLDSLPVDERQDLMEFAQMIVAEHGLGDFGPRFDFNFSDASRAQSNEDELYDDDEDEGVIHDEA